MIAAQDTNTTRIERIKKHVKRNKTVYIVGGVCLIVGAVGGAALVRTGTPEVLVQPKINQILSWKPEAKLEVYIEALGDPGNIIQDTTTGTIYASQGQAAKAIGTSASQMSKHLNGALEHIDGHEFVKLGKAVTPAIA